MASKIVMIYPPIGNIVDYNTPTGTLYVATYLQEHGYDVKFIDCSVENDWHDRVLDEVKDAICFGSYCMSIHIKHLIPLLEEVKRINPAIKTVLGGAHPTLFPEQTAADPMIDFVVIGEGEETMLELVQFIEAGKTDFLGVKGISYRQDGHVIITSHREFIDMDTLPFVDWSLMSQKALDSMKTKIARVQTSRGCPFKCSFCINVVSKNTKMRYRSPQKVVDEMEHIVKTYGVKRIGVRDEVFLTNRQQVKEISEEIIKRNLKISWLANPHIKFTRNAWLDEELIGLMAKSGCNKLQCGGESGSQRILDMLHKTITPADILTFVKRAKEHNIIPLVAFMTSFPT
ncbi:MAG: radical SAM protein, partial [Candidatus Methanoperedens sp.]|nr:radical SAM protein [Candidatus Methanoperedens sp.]